MATAITEGVKVSVKVEYQPDYSSPSQFHYVFTYRIRIENRGSQSVQLIDRHWYIHDTGYLPKVVNGDGVVGQQPILEPNGAHEYVSGCNLRSGIGKMYGTYGMERLIDGRRFEVIIPEFVMIAPFRDN